jgi:hypothetical protein
VRDLGDPQWVTTDQCPIHDSTQKLSLSGSILYLAETSHLGVVNVANPASPVLLVSYTANCGGLAVGGGMLFTGDTVDAGRVYAFGLSNPTAPAFLGDLACAHSYLLGADEVALYEPSAGQRYLLTAYDASPAEFEWVEMLDVTPPLRYGDQSLLLYQGDLAGVENDWIFDMAVAGDWVYLAYENHGVTISHIGSPSGYSYSLDASPGTLPDTTAESAGGPAGSVTLTAPSDGTSYFHVRAGQVGGAWGATAATFTVHIDSRGPTTTAYGVTVKKGKWVNLGYKAGDPGPGCGRAAVTLKVYKGAKLKKTIAAGVSATNVRTSYHWRCTLAKGAYTIKVFATDQAGNAQVKVGSAKLTVK